MTKAFMQFSTRIRPYQGLCWSAFCPDPALLNSFAIVALFFVIGEFIEQLAGKIAAKSAIFELSAFATGFYRALFAPERLSYFCAAVAVHFFAVFAGIAYDSTS